MKKILILGGSYLQVPLIKSAKKDGHHVAVVDINAKCEGFQLADEKIVCSTLDYECIENYVKNNKIDAILTMATDRPVLVISKIAEKFQLISTSYKSASNAINKIKMRTILGQNNVNIPAFFGTSDVNEYLKTIHDFSHREELIVKSSDNSGKRGITKINTGSSSKQEILDAFRYAFENSISQEVLVEELLYGREFSVESVTFQGQTNIVAITEKGNTGAPHYVEITHTQPSNISEEQKRGIENEVRKAIAALEIDNAGTHIEVMLTKDDEVFVIEVGPRLAGDNISSVLTKKATGVDLPLAALHISLGIPPTIKQTKNKRVKIEYFDNLSNYYQKINELGNLIYEKKILNPQPETTVVVKDSSDRVAYIIYQLD